MICIQMEIMSITMMLLIIKPKHYIPTVLNYRCRARPHSKSIRFFNELTYGDSKVAKMAIGHVPT
jgi:hypothetical protein